LCGRNRDFAGSNSSTPATGSGTQRGFVIGRYLKIEVSEGRLLIEQVD
jgi:hypothetical protein